MEASASGRKTRIAQVGIDSGQVHAPQPGSFLWTVSLFLFIRQRSTGGADMSMPGTVVDPFRHLLPAANAHPDRHPVNLP